MWFDNLKFVTSFSRIMADPYAVVPSAPPYDDENQSFIKYTDKSGNAYDDDDAGDVQMIQYASDPRIASTAIDSDPMDQDPLHETDEGFGHSTIGQRMDYTASTFQDPFFLILWLAHLMAMIGALIYQWSDAKIVVKEANAGFFIISICAVIGAVLGYIWTKVIRSYSGKIIKMMLWLNLAFLLGSATLYFLTLHMLSAVFFLIFTVFFALYMWSIWGRIPFTESLIDMACQIINQYHGTIVISMTILVLQIVWILWWSAITVLYVSEENWNEGVVLLLLCSFYWNLECLKNIGHTTICGVAATWYFSQYPGNPTPKALKRSCTTSLGSIAFGSLVVAVVSTLRQLVVMARRNSKHNLVLCLMDCMLRCLQRMVRYFNMYAFAHVAIYGLNYIESAKTSGSLLSNKGITALINDDLTGFAVFAGSLIGGIICAIIGGTMGRIGTEAPEMYSVFGFMVGFYLCWTILQVVTSCVITIFVCYAEDPHTMSVNHPGEYNKLERVRHAKMTVDDEGAI